LGLREFQGEIRHFYDISLTTVYSLSPRRPPFLIFLEHFSDILNISFSPLALGPCQIFPALHRVVCVFFMIVKD